MTETTGSNGRADSTEAVQLLLFDVTELRPSETSLPEPRRPLRVAEPTSAPTPPSNQPPVDQRERDLIANALGETVFAVAGAGSGKTKHLVERVLNVLLSGKARADQLAVITFTEAAAAELRERIGEELDRVVTSALPRDPLTAQRAADALAVLDSAAITTLHGFARRILSAYPFEAGLPPTFDVFDEARSLADLDEHWVDTVDALLADEDGARAVQWAIVAGAELGKLRAIVRRMGENWDRLVLTDCVAPPAPTRLPRLDAEPVVEPLRRALTCGSRCTDGDDSLLGHLESLGPYLAYLERAAGDDLQLLRMLVWPPTRRLSARTKGSAGAWGGHKPEIISLLNEAEAAREAAVSQAIGAAMTIIGEALGGLAVAAARRRQREGHLQFHDLLVLACELVRDHPDVRTALHGEYRHLFVDEYQDTDPLQAELVTMIAAEPGEPVGQVLWWELKTTPGALFFVGDPLQSIYAFRRADVATFLRTLSEVATLEARLLTNFRAAPGIVDWVNAVFDRVVGIGESNVQPAYVRSSAARPADEGPPGVVSVVGAGANHDVSAAQARTIEAEEVAALFRRAVDDGWPVGAGGRAVQLDDIAVLVPTRTSVPALEAAFDAAGIDYRLESSSLVYDTREVQELLQVLHAIDDPSDSASVVAALRTPGFACGDDDLLRHRSSGGVWDYRVDPPTASADDDPVRLGLLRLRVLHGARTWTGVSVLVARVVEETRQLGAALDGRRWREEWRRLRFVVDQARQFAETSPGTLRQYLAWVDVQRDEDVRVTEVVLPEADAPAVSIMTVHAAKGLEFPMVAVVGLGAAPQWILAPTVLFGADGIELAVTRAICTRGYEAARQDEQRILERERLRLLYVALTRAQNHLVVSVHHPRSSTTIAGALEAVLSDVQHLWDPFPPQVEEGAGPGPVRADGRTGPAGGSLPVRVSVRARVRPRPPAGEPDGAPFGRDDAEELARWSHDREHRFAARPSVISATAVAKLAAAASAGLPWQLSGPDELVAPDEPDEMGTLDPDGLDEDGAVRATDARALWRRGRAGTAIGRAVHAVLQTVDLRTGEGLEAMAQTHAVAEGVPQRSAEVARLARTALESPIVRRAVEGRFWRELYVGAPFGDGVLEGFVDLLFEGPDGLEVVDYKTDQVRSDEAADRLAARYRLQGAAYAAAVHVATGRPVRRCTFLFLRAGEAITRSVDDLDEAIGDVETAVGAG